MGYSSRALCGAVTLGVLAGTFACNPSSDPDVPPQDADSVDGADAKPRPTDTTPPTFAGIKTAVSNGEDQIGVAWEPATDDLSPSGKLTYRVYITNAGAEFHFDLPAAAVSASGATGLIVTGLDAAHDYTLAVHAVDEAGNEDTNKAHREASTTDVTPPVFVGAASATGLSKSEIRVSWSPAKDNGYPADKLKYRVFYSEIPGAEDYGSPSFVTDPGVTTAVIGGLTEAKRYYFAVRAADPAGNVDKNVTEVNALTLDQTAPVFTGLSSATVVGTSVTLSWPAATDNVDPAANIVYDIFRAKSAGGEDFATPSYTTAPGNTTFTAIGLDVTTRYVFVVRARDTSANEDTNRFEKSVTTASSGDTKAPTFTGLDTMTAVSATSIGLTWTAAIDDISPSSLIVYDIYVSKTSKGEDFTAPSFTTTPGATGFTIPGLKSLTAYYVVVRARDQAGNREANVNEKGTPTLSDTTPPTFGGVSTVTTFSPTQLQLSWSAASDDVSLPANLRYRVYRATAPGGEPFGAPLVTTLGGVTGYVAGGLAPSTPYYFVVRGVDEAGNEETNTKEKTGTTGADKNPPTFGGAASIIPQSATTALVTWGPAVDDVDPASTIVYTIHVGTTAGGEPLTPTVTTAPGATSYILTGLTPGASYFVIVHATDSHGNVESNIVERSTTLPADKTPPAFSGATGVSGATISALTVNWGAATDAVSAAANITYLICRSTVSHGCDGASFTGVASVVGGTSYTFTGLATGVTSYFVVRAQDEAGNRDANSVEVSGATTADTLAPTFGGLVSATTLSDGSIGLSWVTATDNVSSSTQIVYDVYSAVSPGGEVYSTPLLTTSPGVIGITITALTPSKNYYFVVRARDTAGNFDLNTTERGATTDPDATAPMFGGVTSISVVSETQLRANWTAATDDNSPSTQLDYRVCWSTSATGCTSTSFTPMLTTAKGATTADIGGIGVLLPATTYYVVVRARDLTGNLDANDNAPTGRTLDDTTPPSWLGVGPTVTAVFADTPASSKQLTVNWSAAVISDNAWLLSKLHYEICATTASTADCASWQVTPDGASSATVGSLSSRTAYNVFVRAVDGSSQTDTGTHKGSATTATSFSQFIDGPMFGSSGTGGCKGAGCHNTGGTAGAPPTNPGVFTWTNTVNVTACGGKYVLAGDPSHSLIYTKMAGTFGTCGSSQMPVGGPFDAAQVTRTQQVLDWINEGAHNN